LALGSELTRALTAGVEVACKSHADAHGASRPVLQIYLLSAAALIRSEKTADWVPLIFRSDARPGRDKHRVYFTKRP
jgi:hypothetical protein